MEVQFTNGATLVNYSNKGDIKLTLNTPKLLRALKFTQDAHNKDKFIPPYGSELNVCYNDFNPGKVAMINSSSMDLSSVKFKADFVPFPVGPDNKKG